MSKRVVKDDTKDFELNNCNVGVAFTYGDEAAEKSSSRKAMIPVDGHTSLRFRRQTYLEIIDQD